MVSWDRSCFFSLSVFWKNTLSVFTVQYNVICFYSTIQRYLSLQCSTTLPVCTVQYVICFYSTIQRYLSLQCNTTLSVFTVQYVICFYSAVRYLFLQCNTTLLPRVKRAAVRMFCSAKCRHHKMHANHEKSLNYNKANVGVKSHSPHLCVIVLFVLPSVTFNTYTKRCARYFHYDYEGMNNYSHINNYVNNIKNNNSNNGLSIITTGCIRCLITKIYFYLYIHETDGRHFYSNRPLYISFPRGNFQTDVCHVSTKEDGDCWQPLRPCILTTGDLNFCVRGAPSAGLKEEKEEQTQHTKGWRRKEGGGRIQTGGGIFFSRVNFLCWLLFRYPFHPRVT